MRRHVIQIRERHRLSIRKEEGEDMAIEDIVALVITCSIGAVVVVISAVLLSGRGAGVIAGFKEVVR